MLDKDYVAARWGQFCVLINHLFRLDGLILPSRDYSPCSGEEKKIFILSCDVILFYPFLTKLVLSTWLDIGVIHFLTNIQLP